MKVGIALVGGLADAAELATDVIYPRRSFKVGWRARSRNRRMEAIWEIAPDVIPPVGSEARALAVAVYLAMAGVRCAQERHVSAKFRWQALRRAIPTIQIPQ